jgi:hypothetical protein
MGLGNVQESLGCNKYRKEVISVKAKSAKVSYFENLQLLTKEKGVYYEKTEVHNMDYRIYSDNIRSYELAKFSLCKGLSEEENRASRRL